jgi:RNA-binding protein YlmH
MSFSKEYLLEYFHGNRELAVHLVDKANRVKKTWSEDFTDFLGPDEQYLLREVCKDLELYVDFYGVKGNYEKAMAVISPTPYTQYLKITGNLKFETLDHRDYLGSLLSLGIKREKIGDINVFEDGAEFVVHSDIADYIILNLGKIKHTGIKVQKIDFDEAREKIQMFKESSIIASSMRIDSIISSITNLSRSQSLNSIKKGEVKVNFMIVDEPSKKLKECDLLSIKGHGRYKIAKLTGVTKKERLTLLIYKYI